MATTPGILTDWPWKRLGSFKYVVLAPWVAESICSSVTKEVKEWDLTKIIIPVLLVWRMIHNEIWISLSRHQTAKGKNRIVDKPIEFEQVDRERDWDDQIIFNGILLYLLNMTIEGATNMPIWRTDGVVIIILLHIGAVEFLYYWFHRALHHHFLYSRYHSHHHSSIATEPITSVIHPFAEHILYFMLFAIPMVTTFFTKTTSIAAMVGYHTYIDLMNNMGHCNFEFIPNQLFSLFPPLKYLMYTPSYHSLHHTQFRTNYCLFMPFYDYLYGTIDKSTDTLHETSLQREEEYPNVVHLTHLTTSDSIYQNRLGFASLASHPQTSSWYLWLMWPVTVSSMMVTWIYGQTFVVERNVFKNLKIQTWAIPKYNVQYSMQWQREAINSLIEKAILVAEEKGIKVLTLGLRNQRDELNRSGELFVRRHPKLKLKLVDGSSLAVAIVLNSIPKGTIQVALKGNMSKIASSIALALCDRGIEVFISSEDDYTRLRSTLNDAAQTKLILSNTCTQKTWLVGDGLTNEEQLKATKGTLFIPFLQFPPKRTRKDCFYYNTPAMLAPEHLENVDSCENWLPRRAMSAGRIAGILHALEGWDVNECGDVMLDIDRVWEACLRHGFHPLSMPGKFTSPSHE